MIFEHPLLNAAFIIVASIASALFMSIATTLLFPFVALIFNLPFEWVGWVRLAVCLYFGLIAIFITYDNVSTYMQQKRSLAQ